MSRAKTLLCVCAIGQALTAQEPAKVDFARDVQPLLREHCIECHGPSQQMRGLRLDRRNDAMPNRVGANGARIVPGNSSRSSLYLRVSATQSATVMPPSGALRPEQIALIKTWIDQGANWPDELSGSGDSRPPDPVVVDMVNALRNGDRQGFKRLLRDRPEAVQAKGPNGWTPLMYAALYGDGETIRLLLESGANPNVQNDRGGTALMYAVDNEEKTRLLLDHGADPNLRSGEGQTALLIGARRTGSYSVVKLLLDKGADAGVRLADGSGALGSAVASRDPAVLKLLVDHGVVKNGVPLGASLVAGCTGCFDLLLPLAKPADLAGGLQGAVRAGDVPGIKALLDRGARPNSNLLLTVAAAPAAIPLDTIRALIAAGADLNAKTSTGITLLDFAKRNRNDALVEALTKTAVRDESLVPSRLDPKPARSARAAVESILPALQRADVSFVQKAGCVSCHNNSLTAMTIAAARKAGMKVNEQIAKDQSRRIAGFLQENGERALENLGIPGGVDTVSYILLGLAADGYPSDTITDSWALYLKHNQASDGRWTCQALRPPLESSDFEVTAASLRSLKTYGPKTDRPDYDKAVERATHWLESGQPISTEDHVFKILGLVWGGGSPAAIRTTARQLLALQRSDGGWSQIKRLPSDAYATGQALVALHEARGITTNTPAYQRGIQYLRSSQLEDGSWHVGTRAAAIQPPFDSGFPHGPDQFLSVAASNWASMALLTVLR
jgi:ankyrin repeat protein